MEPDNTGASDAFSALLSTYSHGRDPSLLAKVLTAAQVVLAGDPSQRPSAGLVAGLLFECIKLGDNARNPAPWGEAAELARTAAAQSRNPAAESLFLFLLAQLLYRQFVSTKNAVVLNDAVDAARRSIILCEAGDDLLLSRVNLLTAVLRVRSSVEEQAESGVTPADDLEEALDLAREAADQTTRAVPPDPEAAHYCASASDAARKLFHETGNTDLLVVAVEYSLRAVTLKQPIDLYDAESLVEALHDLYEYRQTDVTPDPITSACLEAIDAAPGNQPAASRLAMLLGNALRARFRLTGDEASLAASIAALRRAVDIGAKSSDRHACLANLGLSLVGQFRSNGDVTALEEGVEAHRAAITAVSREHPHYPGYLSDLAVALHVRHQHTGDAADLTEAVELLRRAVVLTPAKDALEAQHLHNLGTALSDLSNWTGSADVLEEAVAVHRRAVENTAPADPSAGLYLSGLTTALLLLARRNSDERLLREAVDAARRAVADDGPGASHGSAGAANLASALTALYEETKDAGVLEEAIEMGRRAAIAAETAREHQELVQSLTNLAWALTLRAETEPGAPASLTEAITIDRRVLAMLPESHVEYTRIWANLAIAASEQVVNDPRGTDPALLTEAIKAGRRALGFLSPDHPQWRRTTLALQAALGVLAGRTGDPAVLAEQAQLLRGLLAQLPASDADRATYQSFLGSVLAMLAHRSADPAHLAEAIDRARDALAATRADDPRYCDRLQDLGRRSFELADATGDDDALTEAVAVLHQAVDRTPGDSPQRPYRLASLGHALRLSFDRSTDQAVLNEAVRVRREVLAEGSATASSRAEWLSDLGDILRIQSHVTGDSALLDEAVETLREAVRQVGPDVSDSFSALMHLGSALSLRYVESGDLATLNEAVDVTRRAAAAGSSEVPENLAACLSNLASHLARAFERTGDLTALTEALDTSRRAVELTPRGHSSRPNRLSNLGMVLRHMYERTGRAALLEEGLAATRQAVSEALETHKHYPVFLGSLGVALLKTFEFSGQQTDLDECIAAFRQASDAAYNRVERAGHLANLSLALRVRHGRTDDVTDLRQAADAARSATATLPPGHPGRAAGLLHFSRALRAQYIRTGAAELLSAARHSAREAADSTEADPAARLEAARELGRLETTAGAREAALAAIETAVGLLPQLAGRSLHPSDRRDRIARTSGLAAQAAAAAVAADRPERAVELLEQSRGIVLGQEMDIRDDVNELRRHSASLADHFVSLRRASEAIEAAAAIHGSLVVRAGIPEYSDDTAASVIGELRDLAEQRRALALQWDDLLTQIRGLKGMEDFLQPTYASLRAEASAGPIVYVYCAEARSDALVVTADRPVRVIPLPRAEYPTTTGQVRRFLQARQLPRHQASAEIREVLTWVGEAITGPVLDALGLTGMPGPDGPWPRVWWCPVGFLAYLPLHAAGNALDQVTSSYTATIRALARARVRDRRAHANVDGPATQHQALVIGPADADGSSLPGVVREVGEVSKLLPGCRVLTGADANADSVAAALGAHDIAHFACHGVSDWVDPARSGLVLHGGQLLTASQISQVDLPGAALAYLSACSTADAPPALTDEAVHLSAAFQLAGYTHVVATLWPISDTYAAEAACSVYRKLRLKAGSGPGTAATAEALHKTACVGRASYPDQPILWGAFIHTGP